ncbi:hypothetical protein CSC70_01640 [Pseudoxanthomonas kalamensis DSM 18571]|uniref:hypothetical protein n=1 Tax=Pseudoxanthomonas kalamensis TaxID=289483 RepID=UPI001390F711|nr:hypothetical protein [Pseudoxanthomonas kalamensis]KAF1712256.1 hypothetical protein CSC70_01640 [Pseudoxanthomonas kalamensis DSM 18571]
MNSKIQMIASALIGALGLALLAMMIVVEDEPGAIPLALILVGAIGCATGWMRGRAARSQ